MSGSTLFQVHHRNALKASQRMNRLFWIGMLLSFVIYVLLVFFLAKLFITDASHHKLIVTAVMVASLAPLVVLYGYSEARQAFRNATIKDKMTPLGARAVEQIRNQRERQYLNVLEEMAIAAGISPPAAYILDNDMRINALAMTDADGHTAIAVSQGTLAWLNRDELQALIGHETGHIANQDVILYSRLSAMLHGYFLLSEWRQSGDERVNSAPEAFWRFNITGEAQFIINLLSNMFGWFGFVMLMYGHWMQAQFSREREWMADASAVKFARNSEALVATLKKALALQGHFPQFTDPPRSQQHFLFINYHPPRFQFATHPPLEKRIARYGGKVSKRELEDLRYQMRKQNTASPLDNPAERNKQMFANAVFFPILAVQRESKLQENVLPAEDFTHLNSAILAFFIYHSDNTLLELKINNIIDQTGAILCERYIDQLNRTPPLAHPALFCRYLDRVESSPQSTLNDIHRNIKQLIQLDNIFTLYEWCFYALFIAALDRNSEGTETQREQTASAVQHFITWLVTLLYDKPSGDTEQHDETAEQDEQPNTTNVNSAATIYNQLCTEAFPAAPKPYRRATFSNQEMREGIKRFHALLRSKSVYRQQLLHVLGQWQNAQNRLSLPAFYLLFTLERALHSPSPTRSAGVPTPPRG